MEQVIVKMQLKWHSAVEKPEEGRNLIVIVESSDNIVWFATTYWFDNGKYGNSKIVAWAYIEDARSFLQKINDVNINKHFNADFVSKLHDNAKKAIQG